MIQTPVAFIIFNRPDLTRTVFEAIRAARPSQLFVIADGARNVAEKEKCQQAREVITSIDWECEVITNFSDVNLGCKLRLSSGISWLFEQVEEAIILEDDCLPHPSFFEYCETMLKRYRSNKEVMHISGVNFQNGRVRGKGSYYFSKYAHIWGWATWKRAWKHYDVQMEKWPEFSNSKQFQKWCLNEDEKVFWSKIFNLVYSHKLDTWDYQWVLAIIRQNGLCVMPNCNLIANLGFRHDATHTQQSDHTLSEMATSEYVFPDTITSISVNRKADLYTFNNVLNSQVVNKGYQLAFRAKVKSVLNFIGYKSPI